MSRPNVDVASDTLTITEGPSEADPAFRDLNLLASGRTNSEVARDLYISVGTVKSHTNNIYRKLGARNRTGALARARGLNLLSG